MKQVIMEITFKADLDQVPGWGDNPQDWVALVKQELERNEHYNTEATINSVTVVQKR